MQVVLILGGGIGKRFGTVLPKQYNLIDGKPVIDYVIEAAPVSYTHLTLPTNSLV